MFYPTHVVLLVFIAFNRDTILARRGRKPIEPKIIGGEEVDIADYPYMANLLLFDGSKNVLCGGSIISNRHVLTAAHCLRDKKEVTVRIGSTRPNSGGRVYKSKSFAKHPRYVPGKTYYDVGLVNMPETMSFKGISARTIPLIKEGQVIPSGSKIRVSGWGRTGENKPASSKLLAITVSTYDNRKCYKMFYTAQYNYYELQDYMFCAGARKGGVGFWKGDSGGPAVMRGIQVGIVSGTYGVASPNIPDFYTNITNSAIRRWIKKTSGI